MKRIVVVFAFALVQLGVYSQKVERSVTPASSFSAERLKRIDDKIESWIASKRMPGAVVLILKDGKPVYQKAYGYDNAEKKTPMRTDLLFRLASQTKAVTSVGIMMLYEEGKFLLDDPLHQYIPAFRNLKVLDKFNAADTTFTTVDAKRPVTIRDLLTHTSGIGYALIGSSAANAIYAKHGIPAGLSMEEGTVLAEGMTKLASLPLFHQPGERFTYGLNTDLLGYLIEVVSKQSLDQFFRTRIFEPLGMKDTYFYLPTEKQNRLASLNYEDASGVHVMREQFTFNGAKWNPNYPSTKGTFFSGGAGLTSTISNYSVFLQMLLNGGSYNGVRILSPSTVRLMTTNQIGDLNLGSDKFGLGFSIASEKSAAKLPVSAGTYGWGGAFGTTYWIDPKEKIVAQLYTQIWARRTNVEDAFKALVYQALTD